GARTGLPGILPLGAGSADALHRIPHPAPRVRTHAARASGVSPAQCGTCRRLSGRILRDDRIAPRPTRPHRSALPSRHRQMVTHADAPSETPHRDISTTMTHLDTPAETPHRDVSTTSTHADMPAKTPHRDVSTASARSMIRLAAPAGALPGWGARADPVTHAQNLMDWLFTPEALLALGTLTLLEVVLGIDNLVFLTILAGKLPEGQQPRARRLGLGLALMMRILLLLVIGWIIGLTAPLFEVLGQEIS